MCVLIHCIFKELQEYLQQRMSVPFQRVCNSLWIYPLLLGLIPYRWTKICTPLQKAECFSNPEKAHWTMYNPLMFTQKVCAPLLQEIFRMVLTILNIQHQKHGSMLYLLKEHFLPLPAVVTTQTDNFSWVEDLNLFIRIVCPKIYVQNVMAGYNILPDDVDKDSGYEQKIRRLHFSFSS